MEISYEWVQPVGGVESLENKDSVVPSGKSRDTWRQDRNLENKDSVVRVESLENKDFVVRMGNRTEVDARVNFLMTSIWLPSCPGRGGTLGKRIC